MNSEKKVHQVWTQLSIKRNDNLRAKKKRQFFLKYHKNLNIFPFLGAFIQGRIQISPKNYNLSVLPFWANFCALTLLTRKIKILKKNEKNAWRYYHFTHVYHEWKSYDVWFLRYGAGRQNFFSFCPVFCTFIPLATQNEKNTWIYHNFTQVYQKIWYMIFHFGLFFPF